jgi:hypothetical protein
MMDSKTKVMYFFLFFDGCLEGITRHVFLTTRGWVREEENKTKRKFEKS